MTLLVLLLGVGLLAAPLAVVASDLDPAAKARVGCATRSASPLLLLWRDENRGHWDAADHLAPGGLWAWLTAAVAAAVGLAIAVNTGLRTRRVRRRARFPRWAAMATSSEHGIELRIAPSTERVAYAVPGRDRHIVVSQAVHDGLSPSQLDAVVAHEAAHLVLSHQRYLFVLTLYEQICGWLPGARHTTENLRLAIEQWADTVAVAAFGAEAEALPRAFSFFPSNALSAHLIGARTSGMGRHRTSPPGELVVVLTFVIVLAGAALYSATHSVGDLATVVAAH